MKLLSLLAFIMLIVFLTIYAKNVLTKNNINEFDLEPNILSKSIFDKVKWEKIKENKEVILFMYKSKFEKNNYYKAESIISSSFSEKLYNNLMDFNKYPKIFSKTLIYKKIKNISKNKYLIYCQDNFLPFENRDYYIILEYSVLNKNNIKEWIIEWSPLETLSEKFPDKKGFVRVKDIYGRWKIMEINNKIKISIELFNNFNLPVPRVILTSFEKSSTIDTLNQLINYVMK